MANHSQLGPIKSLTEPASHHLRWYAVANTPIRKGQQLTAKRVRGKFDWLPEGTSFISDPARLIGRYPRQDFNQGDILQADQFSIGPPNQSPDGGLTVLVEVNAPDAATLAPGMRLAFAKQLEKVSTTLILPTGIETTGGLGFLITAITPAGGRNDTALLTAVIPGRWRCMATQLAIGVWRPIVTPQNTVKGVLPGGCVVSGNKPKNQNPGASNSQ